MECVKFFIVLFLIFLFKYSTNSDNAIDQKHSDILIPKERSSDNSHLYKKPSVLIVTLVRNKAHTLPLFLTYLEKQEYPKERISLYFVTDHNIDNSIEILNLWLEKVQKHYHKIHYQYDNSKKLRKSERNHTHWPDERFRDIIKMKENALDYARGLWADFVFVS